MAAWIKLRNNAKPEVLLQIVQSLANWQRDPDLASVRGPELAKLPEKERKGWETLWSDVDELLKKAGGPKVTPAP